MFHPHHQLSLFQKYSSDTAFVLHRNLLALHALFAFHLYLLLSFSFSFLRLHTSTHACSLYFFLQLAARELTL